MRVLIADDQRSFGLTLADLVRYCGHEVVGVVGSGLDAINAYSLHHPDLVLMDYRMPKLNGATACRHIIAKNPDARVILLSAWSPLDGTDQSGAISFLPKPVDFTRLSAALQSVAQSLPSPAPVEYGQSNASAAPTSDALPEVYYQPDAIDYFQPIIESEPAVDEAVPAMPLESELPFPVVTPQDSSDSFDYSPPIPEPVPSDYLSLDPAPESSSVACVEGVVAANAAPKENKSDKRRSNRRRAPRNRAR